MDRPERMPALDDTGARQPVQPHQPTPDDILAFLAETPDIDRLLDAHPGLTREALRHRFAEVHALANARTIRFRKGASSTVFERTHGLPDPDPGMHKGTVFRMLLALLKPGRLLDLGAGKGNFSLAAARLGWNVTAVDARTVRWPDPDTASDPAEARLIRSIRWVQADAREFAIEPGSFDLICILGLLHHLEASDQVALLRRCAGTPLLLDTRIAKAALDRIDGYEGMLVREHGDTREARDQVPTAAWGNAVSFQHTEESLLRLVMDCGYRKMFQMRPPHRLDYTFYLCLPDPKPNRLARRARAGRKHGANPSSDG